MENPESINKNIITLGKFDNKSEFEYLNIKTLFQYQLTKIKLSYSHYSNIKYVFTDSKLFNINENQYYTITGIFNSNDSECSNSDSDSDCDDNNSNDDDIIDFHTLQFKD